MNDVVLAHRFWGGTAAAPSWYLATVVAVDGDAATLKFFSDDKTEQIPTKMIKSFDWQPKTKLSCVHNGRVSGHAEAAELVETLDDEHVRVAFGRDASDREEKTIPVVACSQAPFWYDTLSPVFTDRARYVRLGAAPKSVSAEPSSVQVAEALSRWLATADGGSYITVETCVVTSKWTDLGVGNRHTGRRAATACVVGVPSPKEPKALEACLVLHGACEQKYLGGGRYGGCGYEPSVGQPETIDCGAVKSN